MFSKSGKFRGARKEIRFIFTGFFKKNAIHVAPNPVKFDDAGYHSRLS